MMKNTDLRGSVAISGVGEADRSPLLIGSSPLDLMSQAALRATEDAGIALEEIDGVFAASSQLAFPALSVAEHLGLSPRYFDSTNTGGDSFMGHVHHAMLAIVTGQIDVALIVHGSTQKSVGRENAAPQERSPYEASVSIRLPMAAYAMAAARHMHEFGTTREQLAEVVRASRQWASVHPLATERTVPSIQEIVSARLICSPLSALDCCLVTDGGAAVILVNRERALVSGRKSAFVLGCGEASSHRHIQEMPSLTLTAAQQSGHAAFSMAGMRPGDVNAAQIYDAFSICTILFLEDLGFCKKGEGGHFVSGGNISPGGKFPVNTNGGGLSYCHPGMNGLMLLVEAVRQIRGDALGHQIPNCDVALAHGNGGVLSSQSTVILGSSLTI